MVQGQPQGRETEVWWHQVKVWSAAVVSLLLLSACFIVSCLVNHDNFVYTKIGRKLHKLQDHQQYLSHLTCFKERKGLKDWHCCPTSWSPFQSSCYFISTELKNCTDSEKNCSEMGAHLMMINTKEEQVLSYRFWHPGEPNMHDEHCVIINYRDGNWGWNDAFCDVMQRSICEMMMISL
ncbi:C-type lectin domain family 4 member C-like isoform 4-T4 [Trichechus inunguis]